MKTRIALEVLVAILVFQALVAVPAFAATTHTVTLAAKENINAPGVDDLSFSPPTIVITQGDTVNWTTASFVPHTVTSTTGLFDSTPEFVLTPQLQATLFGPGGFLLPGTSFNTTLTQPGDYVYFCKIHPPMQGTISVTSTVAVGEIVYIGAGWGSESISFTSFSPRHLEVRSGTIVVWTNEEVYEPHTVTSATVPSGAASFDSSPNLTPEALAGFESLPFLIAAGKRSFSYAFTQAGTYAYFCKLHAGMRGSVSVLAPTDLSQINSDVSALSPRLDLSTMLGAIGIVLGGIGTAISAMVWRKLPKKSPA